MPGRLDGRVAIVSGAARGQGEAEARQFVAEGASVVLGDVLDAEGAAVAASLGDQARYVHLDVASEDDWAAAVAAAQSAFGAVDVLVNNAGIIRFGTIAEGDVDDFRRVLMVNQVGCFLGMKAVVPSMVAAGRGSIVNVSSMNGFVGGATIPGYVASKFAIRGMTKTAAMELGPQGIRVNSIHPGAIDTEMAREGLSMPPDLNPLSRIALPRAGTVEEAAELVTWLASDASSYCTGAEFVIDGGWLAGPYPVPVRPGVAS